MGTIQTRPPIPTTIQIAPRGYSFHGQALKCDDKGLLCRPDINPRELSLIQALRAVVVETMDYPPVRNYDAESHLPAHMIERAQEALSAYGLGIEPNPEFMAGEVVR
ncbi:MAG: hypothetical protein K9K35_10475 [Rhodoferax sp.]|nr:hypothetical protein [Rhodoferax sp.]